MSRSEDAMTDLSVATGDVEEEYERQVERALAELRTQVSGPASGKSLPDLVGLVAERTGLTPAVVREALTTLVYLGEAVVTEDRHLVAG